MMPTIGTRSRAKLMKITILAYLEPDATEPDDVMPQVAEALESAGHKTTIVTIHDDVGQIVGGRAAEQAGPGVQPGRVVRRRHHRAG